MRAPLRCTGPVLLLEGLPLGQWSRVGGCGGDGCRRGVLGRRVSMSRTEPAGQVCQARGANANEGGHEQWMEVVCCVRLSKMVECGLMQASGLQAGYAALPLPPDLHLSTHSLLSKPHCRLTLVL